MKKIILLLFIILFSCSKEDVIKDEIISEPEPIPETTPYTSIPDGNFETALIYKGIDDVRDGKVLTSKIKNVTTLIVSKSGINDFSGIEDFTSLEILKCDFNILSVKGLDLSKNLVLKELNIGGCQLKNIDLSKNIALKRFDCYNNPILSLNLSNNKLLTVIRCSNNSELTYLNVKNGNNTKFDSSDSNDLTWFTFLGNTKLKTIIVDNKTYSDTNWSHKKDLATSFIE